jgi:hypothetical protein
MEAAPGAAVIHFGVNCAHPAVAARALRAAVSFQRHRHCFGGNGGDGGGGGEGEKQRKKVLVAYPNDGQYWRDAPYSWTGGLYAHRGQAADGLHASTVAAGARGVGGCCNCSPEHVRQWRALEAAARAKAKAGAGGRVARGRVARGRKKKSDNEKAQAPPGPEAKRQRAR